MNRHCLCGCGRTFPRRTRSLLICKAASARLDSLIEQMPLIANAADPWLARRNRVLVDPLTVTELLAGDMDEAARRVRHRAEHGLDSMPDPRPEMAVA